VFGYAGTGKTPPSFAIEERPENAGGSKVGELLCAAFSGKAALVMTRKGTPASTIIR
jgi:exodeoxyribonuclease-5